MVIWGIQSHPDNCDVTGATPVGQRPTSGVHDGLVTCVQLLTRSYIQISPWVIKISISIFQLGRKINSFYSQRSYRPFSHSVRKSRSSTSPGNAEWSKSYATHGVKGQSVGLVSLKQFITYKNIFKKQLTIFCSKSWKWQHFLRSMYSHVSPCFALLSLKFLGKYSIWQLHCSRT
jgi:hypothetical protein